jgi:hypothetical protein
MTKRAPHLHVPHPHIDLRRLGHDAVVAAEVGLVATVIVTGARLVHTVAEHGRPAVVEEVVASPDAATSLELEVHADTGGVHALVVGLDTSGVVTASLVGELGEPVRAHVLANTSVRFEDVPAGRYQIEVASVGPIVESGDSAISSAVTIRSDVFELLESGDLVVETR